MAQITSSVGLISGINTGALINALLAEDQAPVTTVTNQMNQVKAQQQAYTSLSTQLTSIQTIGQSLQLPSTFQASTATSSNTNVLTATAGEAAAAGTYQLQVSQLVSSQQSISNGYASSSALVGAGTLTIEQGGGSLASQTPLAQLNGGSGVSAGKFRITDASGNTAIIDTSSDINLTDVVNQINNSTGISVKASVQDNHLLLNDTSNGLNGSLTFQDIGNGTTAANLGIAGTAADGVTISGNNINTIGTSTALGTLNDGVGVRTVSTANSNGAGSDFQVSLGDGSIVSVALGDSQSVGDVIKVINNAGKGKLIASVNAAGTGLQLTDKSGGAGSFYVTATNGSNAASDLGILYSGTNGVIAGNPLIASLNSTLISTLNGGKGISLGQISLTDRAGKSITVNLSGGTSVQNILDAINSAASSSGVGITASLNSAGSGIQIADTSGGTGNLVVTDGDSSKTATALGIAGSFDTSVPVDNGANLQHQWVSENSQLSTYNGGQGVGTGTFQITNSSGQSTTVDLSQGVYNTIGDVIAAINSNKIGVTASIDPNGNGLMLTDSSTGAGKLTVTDQSGTSAANLNIAGTSTAADGKTIDGSFEKTITVNSADTLQTIQGKIQQLGFGVSASIINDGTAGSPYHLSLTALNSGKAGSFVFDAGSTSLQTHNLVDAQDAAVFVGGSGTSQPLLVTSSTNTLTKIIPGVTVNLLSASQTPVTLTVAPDPSSIATQLNNFVTDYNGVTTSINTLSTFNTATNTAGLLLGDPTTQNIQGQLANIITAVVPNAGKYRTLADLGISVQSDGTLKFNQDTFNAAYSADPTAVSNLFTQASTGLGTVLNNSTTALVDPVSGLIPIENKSLTQETQQFQDQINSLNQVISDQQNVYELQFANMEETLATLQGQQAALATLTNLTASLAGNSSTSSSSNTSSPSPTSSSTSIG